MKADHVAFSANNNNQPESLWQLRLAIPTIPSALRPITATRNGAVGGQFKYTWLRLIRVFQRVQTAPQSGRYVRGDACSEIIEKEPRSEISRF